MLELGDDDKGFHARGRRLRGGGCVGLRKSVCMTSFLSEVIILRE